MAIEPGIYDDATLPCVIQALNPAAPWAIVPKLIDFPEENKPYKSIPIISWVIQFREIDIRTKLVTYLTNRSFMGDPDVIKKNIMDLPDNSVNSAMGKLFYGMTTLASGMLRPRLDNELSTSVLAMYQLWLGYYLAEMFAEELKDKTDNESRYRFKELTSSKEIIGYTMRQALIRNPRMDWGNKVIIDATEATEIRDVLYCNRSALETYLNRGGSLNSLGAGWITNNTNPSV